MASSFLPVSRTTTTAICTSSNLLVITFTQHLASHPTSGSLLTTSSPLPSLLVVTSHPDQKGLTPLLALLLITVRRHLLTTSSRLPSQLLTRHLLESHHLLALSKSVYHSKCCNATSCASLMLMHFSRLPRIYQVLSF